MTREAIRMVHLPAGFAMTILPSVVAGVALGFRSERGNETLALALAPCHRPERVLYFGLDTGEAVYLRDLLDAALREFGGTGGENHG